MRRFAIALAGIGWALSCADPTPANDDDPVMTGCVERDLLSCDQLYPPTWSQVFEQTVATGCVGGAACHVDTSAAGAQTGFVIDDADATYVRLFDGDAPLVVPGDPSCSPLIARLESLDPDWRMPPGNTPLAAGARCSIAHWIADGAAQ
ncbi:MAG: hypothetical protein B7733_10755 [Myxococcales bacterium FL481]|nr:MAG: hypothetical protein B7733_10755 [Myxococcales bacterium FL481]